MGKAIEAERSFLSLFLHNTLSKTTTKKKNSNSSDGPIIPKKKLDMVVADLEKIQKGIRKETAALDGESAKLKKDDGRFLHLNRDSIPKSISKCTEKLMLFAEKKNQLQCLLKQKEDNKNISLITSKTNYLDP